MHPISIHAESKLPSTDVLDYITNRPPFYWRGSDVTLNLALTTNGTVLKKADVGTLIIEIKNLDGGPAAECLYRTTKTSTDCSAAFTQEAWKTRSKVLLTLSLPAADVAFIPGTYRIIVRHEKVGKTDTFLSARLHVIEDSSESTDLAPPPALDGFIRFGSAQDLTSPQKAQARQNAGAAVAPLILSSAPTSAIVSTLSVTSTATLPGFVGTYTPFGVDDPSLGSRRGWMSEDELFSITWNDDHWSISDEENLYATSGQEVPTPDLITSWIYPPGSPLNGHYPTITPSYTPGSGTPGIVGQFAIVNGTSAHLCLSATPIRWKSL